MKDNQIIQTVLLFLILMTFVACKTIEPQRPPESYLTPDYKPQISTIGLPLEMDMKSVETILNTQLSGLIYEDNSLDNNGGDNLMVKAWKKDNIKISFTGDQFTYRVPLKLWIKAGWKIEKFGVSLSDYRELNAEIALKFRTKITLNPDWSISTKTEADGYDWISSPILKIGPIDVPITFIADLILKYNLKTISEAMDDGMKESLDLRPYAKQAWTDLQVPINLSPEYHLWLSVQPTEVLAMPLSGKNGKIRQVAAIRSLVMCSVGKSQDMSIRSKLPDLKIVNTLSENTVVNMVADIPYAFIDSVSQKNLLHKTFADGKKNITINSINLYGNDDQMIVQADVSGSMIGKLFFKGKPVFNKADSSIRISNFDFEVHTKNILLKSAGWILKGGIKSSIEKKCVYPVAKQIRETQEVIQQSLLHYPLSNGFFITGKLDNFEVQQLYLTAGSIKAAISLQGKVKIANE